VLKSCEATLVSPVRFAGANRGTATQAGSILKFARRSTGRDGTPSRTTILARAHEQDRTRLCCSHRGSTKHLCVRFSGPKIAQEKSMPVFNGANLIGGLLFGSIGFVAFIYGKRMHVWKPMLLGLALMAYPYFVANNIVLFAIGVIGTAALFLFRD